MEGIIAALALLTPLNVFMAALGGVVFGFAFKDFYFHKRTIFLCILWIIGFSIGRILFVGVVGVTGTGILGTLLFLIYLSVTLITRKILTHRKHSTL